MTEFDEHFFPHKFKAKLEFMPSDSRKATLVLDLTVWSPSCNLSQY
jgi:hypothetical protein